VRLVEFKTMCLEALQLPEIAILETHRGIKETLAKLLVSILSLGGLIAPIARLSIFSPKTDSAKRIEELAEAVCELHL